MQTWSEFCLNAVFAISLLWLKSSRLTYGRSWGFYAWCGTAIGGGASIDVQVNLRCCTSAERLSASYLRHEPGKAGEGPNSSRTDLRRG